MAALRGPFQFVESRTATASESIVLDLPAGFDTRYMKALRIMLDVTAAATEVDDTLDVFLQSGIQVPGGSIAWDDFIHFTRVLGNGGTKQFIAVWQRDGQTPESEVHAPSGAAIGAGVVQGPIGKLLRVRSVIVDAGGSAASFTYGIYGDILEG
jgi:hypothetical protein